MINDTNPMTEHELLRAMDINGINNPTRKARDLLTESELDCFWTLWLRCGRAGTLKQIYGDYWWSIRGPRKFGRRVSNTIRAGKLPGLKRVDQKSKSNVYDWPRKAPSEPLAANEEAFNSALPNAA